MKQTYWEKLQDPRWQQKRLEAMQAKEFHCEICWDNESTLHVHHKEYFKNYEPWDYDNNQLAVLCKTCHENLHESIDLYKWIGSYARLDGSNNRDELAFVLCGYIGYSLEEISNLMGIEITRPIDRYYKAGVRAKEYAEYQFKKYLEEKKNAK